MKAMHIPPSTQPEDMQLSREWLRRFFREPGNLPVTFNYAGEHFQGIPKPWNPRVARRRIDANITETIIEGRHPSSNLEMRCEIFEYLDFPVVEWTTWFHNPGKEPSGLLTDVLAMDCGVDGKSPVITHCNGDFYHETGYTTERTSLRAGDALNFTPRGGRPCDGAFPYYRLVFESRGLSLAIGWPGQWAVSFLGTAGGARVQAGQEKISMNLLPGEKIRTPRITLLTWTGDETRAVNLWRRWYLAHILPRPNGAPLRPMLAVCGPEEGEEFTAATEENQVENIEKFVQHGIDFDVWWIDAGWYPCYNDLGERKWWITGTWEPDTERFPNGIKPVSDHAAKHSADLLVWFEPERVRPGTSLDRQHPGWLLHSEKDVDRNSLLNLGDPEVRDWLTDHVCKLIQENGIKIYRQDFNFEPLDHWRSNDKSVEQGTPGALQREGINENLHVQAYLQYWDDLLMRNPGLWIDSCSSGGRRNDLETMRRSVPLHYTDYGYGIHPVKLAFHRTLFEWIPYFKEATLSWDIEGIQRFDPQVDSFSFHCGMAAMLFASLDIRRQDYDFILARKLLDLWRMAADYLLNGDFYPLTPAHRNSRQWVAWQFDRPEKGDGMIQGIRLQECPQESLTVIPHGIESGCLYYLENPEDGESQELPGETLLKDGLAMRLSQRSAKIWFYHKKLV